MHEIFHVEHGTLKFDEHGIMFGDSDGTTLYDPILDTVYVLLCPRCHETVEPKDTTCKHCDFSLVKP